MKDPNTTGKQRASRIPLDYYKTPDPVSSRKLFLTKLACLATLVWIFTLIPACAVPAAKKSPVGLDRFSHGPVCKMHQSIGYECSACHVNFPMLGGREKEDSISLASRSTFSGDLKCLECHLGDKRGDKFDGFLAVHHATQLVSKTPNCGTCHQDHKGLNQDLKRMADANCTNCHKDLGNAMNGTPHHAAAISAFSDDHPDFRPAKEPDPSKIKFNHQYHMTDGIVLAKGGKPWTVADMKDGEQKLAVLQRVGSATAAVKLDCVDCHKPEARDDRAWAGNSPVASVDDKEASRKAFAERRAKRDWTPRGELEARHTPGAYMEPIKYDRNCASCHPLTIDAKGTTVTHNQQPKELKAEVARLIGTSPAEPAPSAFFPLPGKKPAGGTLNPEARVEMVMRTLMEGKRTCGECHVSKDGSDLSISTTEIAKPDIPNVWFKHARFDHSQHDASRGISCVECHKQAYPTDDKGVQAAYAMLRKGAEIVMLPDIKKCQECHSPKPTDEAVKNGWRAKYDCTECHNYHHGTRPKTGNQK
jgi:Cytochrome c7 and related cytochrome c